MISNAYEKLEHRHIWEKNCGQIPEGFMIHHIDWDKLNNNLNNLICVSRKVHGFLHRLPNRKRIVFPSGNIKVIKITTIKE